MPTRTPLSRAELLAHAERLGLSLTSLRKRLNSPRWTLERALTTPPLHGGGRWSKMIRGIDAYEARQREHAP